MSDLKSYHSAIESAAFFVIPEPGYLSISGKDRVDFLQRQTTNDVVSLTSNNALMSVLTSPKARILDVFWLIDEEDGIGIVTLPGRSADTFDFLRSRIFFNDDVSLTDQSQDFAQIVLQGPKAAESLTALGFPIVEISHTGLGELEGEKIACIGQPGFGGISYRLLVPMTGLDELKGKFTHLGIHQMNVKEFDNLRIEAGLAGEANELTEDYTPLEVGLLDIAISNTKGCFTGQEIIARQVNFGKITRKLVGLFTSSLVQEGASVVVDGKPAGKVTSVVHSPRFGDIALAVLKRPFEQAGTIVKIGDTKAEVIELPF